MNKDERKKKLEEMKTEIVPYQKVIFDIETTGLNPYTDEILQISAINEEGEVLLNTYVKPAFLKRWDAAEKIHGITPDMVNNCKTMEELWESVQRVFLSAAELIAYNGNFDMQFLKLSGIEFPEDAKYSDVMLEFAPIFGEWNEYYQNYKWQKLITCAEYYNFDFKAHDSLEDVKATLHCYKKMRENDLSL